MKRRRRAARTAALALVAAGPLLLFWPPLRETLESRMLLHMLVEFPLLLGAGWAAHRACLRLALPRCLLGTCAALDEGGWTGATLLFATTALWMLPLLLDLSLLSAPVAAAKYAAWLAAGWALAGSWRRLAPELRQFLVVNLAWMSATAGLLYAEAPQRLCANYLQGDQRQAGMALVLLAAALAAFAWREALRPAAWAERAGRAEPAARAEPIERPRLS